MKRLALIELRSAIATDFANPDNSKKYGVAYFHQNSKGAIESKIHYFTPETDMIEFKNLYNHGQIFVIANPNELKSTFNCFDWELMDQQLDYELEQVKKVLNIKNPV